MKEKQDWMDRYPLSFRDWKLFHKKFLDELTPEELERWNELHQGELGVPTSSEPTDISGKRGPAEQLPTKERVERYYGVELTDPSPERLKELRTFWTEWQRKKSKPEE